MTPSLAQNKDNSLDVAEDFAGDAQSIGALHGSARGNRNVSQRLAAMERLVPLRGQHLLDVGCGTGEYTTALAENFETVDGIEIERNRLEVFKENAPEHVNLHMMSANKLDFEDDTFDTIVMIEVLEHLTDIEGALSELSRVLTPRGRIVLTTPSRRWPFEQHGVLYNDKRYPSYYAPGLVWIKSLHEKFSDAAAFEPKDIENLAASAGLELENHTFMMPPLDSFDEGHVVHKATEAIEGVAQHFFGQTIVASLRHT